MANAGLKLTGADELLAALDKLPGTIIGSFMVSLPSLDQASAAASMSAKSNTNRHMPFAVMAMSKLSGADFGGLGALPHSGQ